MSGSPAEGADPSALAVSAAAVARADGLREGTDAERAQALAIYLAHPVSFDPDTAEGRTRLHWILLSGRGTDPVLGRAIERAAKSPECDETLRRAANTAISLGMVRRGEHDAAEDRLVAALQVRRGTPPDRDDFAACLGLSWSCSMRMREFEALVFARRAQRIAETLDDARSHAMALLSLGTCRMQLGALGAADRTFDHLEAILSSLPPARAATIVRQVHAKRSELGLLSGDLPAARRHFEAWLAIGLPTDGIDHFDLIRTDAEAQILIGEGRAAEALALLDVLPRNLAPAVGIEFDVELRRASALVALGREEMLLGVVEPLLTHLLDHGQALLGPGRALVFASEFGRVLQDAGAPRTLAARAHEFAARMALARLGELESAAERLDAAEVLQDADRQDLGRFRASFAERHRLALEALSSDFAGVAAEAVERLAGFVHGDGAVRICAWCLVAWLPDGRPAPVGHILQSAAPDAVTHGICPSCVATVRRGSEAPAWPGGGGTTER